MKKRVLAAGAAATVLATLALTQSYAAGLTGTFPVVGGASYCASTVTGTGGLGGITGQGQGSTGSICAQTIPAGPPALTGEEMIKADSAIANSSPPQTIAIPSSILGNSTNRLIGGDMTTNLAQRSSTAKGVTALANQTPTAAIITADRWWLISPAGATTTTIDSTAATAVIPGFNNTKALRQARTTSGAAGIQCVGQTLDAATSAPLIGNNAIFSFYEFNGAGQSATNGNITVNVDYSTAADTAGTQATLGYAGGNGSLFALGDVGLLSAGPTNMTRAITGFSDGTTGSLSAGVATIAASTTWTRYSVYATIPVNAPGTTTPVTNVSVSVCFTPIATTAITTDYIELDGMQLEAKPSTPTADLPNGVISPSAFERRPAAIEQALELYYWYYFYENQSLVSEVPYSHCVTTTSTTASMCDVSFPETMRITPVVKLTDGFQLFTSTAYTTLGALNTLAIYANTLTTVASKTGFMMSAVASTVPAVGVTNFLMSLGTSSSTGIISASAEP